MSKLNYFDINTVIEEYPDTTAYIVVGQRGVGKSYSIKKYVIDHFIETGMKFIYIRRNMIDINKTFMTSVFADVMAKEKFTLPKTEGYTNIQILPRNGYFYVCGETDKHKTKYLYEIGRIISISQGERFKGGTYIDYDTLFFDEFITERGYWDGDREPDLFNKILNTVARADEDKKVKVFLAGNPDSQIEMCPYLYDMHLDYQNMDPNKIYLYNTVSPNGEVQENTKLFVKLAELGSDYLNITTYGIWGVTGEDVMAVTGSVKLNHYIQETEELLQRFKPMYQIISETAIQKTLLHRRKIYIYIGELDKLPCIFVESHHINSFNIKDLPTLYSRYDQSTYIKNEYTQIYRLRIPTLSEYNMLRTLLLNALEQKMIITKDDMAGTILESIINER